MNEAPEKEAQDEYEMVKKVFDALKPDEQLRAMDVQYIKDIMDNPPKSTPGGRAMTTDASAFVPKDEMESLSLGAFPGGDKKYTDDELYNMVSRQLDELDVEQRGKAMKIEFIKRVMNSRSR
jgi:hypothetical protein